MPTETTPGDPRAGTRVDKVIRLIGTSTRSWEDAAQTAIAEAAQSIRDLDRAKVLEKDITLTGAMPVFRVKLEVSFQLDRNRIDAGGLAVQVRRYLIVANHTLASAGLGELIDEYVARSPAEFHVLVPQTIPTSTFADPATGAFGPSGAAVTELTHAARGEAERRLESFMLSYSRLGPALTGEILLADPVSATRAVMARSSFDEIIVSTLPAGISRWLKLDLPHRLERIFDLPVTTLVQHDRAPDRR